MNDLISRQKAIDEIKKHYRAHDNDLLELIAFEIGRLPSVQPERKKGKWIKKMRITETEKYTSYDPEWYCACCGTKYDSHVAKMVNFCYVCGDDMRGGEE